MWLRWLFSIAAAFAVLTGSVTAHAASGMVGDSECCCPNPDTCKCHDHDQDAQPEPMMKRCGGEAQLVAPAVVVAALPEPIVETVARTITVVTTALERPEPEPRHASLDKPPF